ncbi:MAG: glycoside hydrolase [Oscillospiraceae bacterium]|nr:glycoside hydrolase [Oscillospiraceae bacterium]
MTKSARLTIAIILVASFILLQACTSNETAPAFSEQRGSFSFSGNSFHVQYFGENNDMQIPVPEPVRQCLMTDDQEIEPFDVFVHPRVTAFVSGGNDDNAAAATVYSTVDEGKNWSGAALPKVREQQLDNNSAGNLFSSVSIGFTSASDGWIIGSLYHGMGNQENFVYISHDFGKSWEEVNNINDQYARVLLFGLFTTERIGFMCFRFELDTNPLPMYRTADGGMTWDAVAMPEIDMPEDSYYQFSALQPQGDTYRLLLSNPLSADDTATLISSDFGATWSIENEKR